MTDDQHKRLKKFFPGLKQRDFGLVFGETVDDGGFYCSAYIRAGGLRSGPKTREQEVVGIDASAATYGRTTQASAISAVRDALVDLHAELGRILGDKVRP